MPHILNSRESNCSGEAAEQSESLVHRKDQSMILLLSPKTILWCTESSPPCPFVDGRFHVQLKLLGDGTVPFKRVMLGL